MEDSGAVSKPEKVLHYASTWLAIAGSIVLFILVILTTVDVSLRYFLNHPIKGVFELTELMMVAIVVLSLGYTTYEKAHVSVDLMVTHFSKRGQKITEVITLLLGIFIFCLIIWQSTLYAFGALHVNEHSDILEVPTFYFKLLVPIGSLLLTLELIISLIKSIRGVASR